MATWFDVEDTRVTKEPPLYFTIDDKRYAIITAITPGMADIFLNLMVKELEGFKTVVAGDPVTQARVDKIGGVAPFLDRHVSRWNTYLSGVHNQVPTEIDDLFKEIMRYLSDNLKVQGIQVAISH